MSSVRKDYRKVSGAWIGFCWILLFGLVVACQPELPVSSSIIISDDGSDSRVNADLYGLTLEEINHGVDGGLYAELIQNRSFEDGMPPLNCPYDARNNLLYTPNGYGIPFLRGDSLPGWHALNPAVTQLYPDTRELINPRNRRSLMVAVSASWQTGRGGLVAEGYRGIPLQEGKRYRFSFFAKSASTMPKSVRIALEDSTASRVVSDSFEVVPIPEWRRYEHLFTVTSTVPNAVLTLSADTSNLFWVDMVSLMPEDTWKGHPNGTRADLSALIKDLAPRFIRFPGGSFVEGYTAGTFPTWRETVGDVANRKSFWNVWAYGTTNGMGYHEYLQFCEDIGAEPIYVINSGVTSQSRRPRYEDITAMNRLVEEALEAIAYANAPVDSTLGAWRAEQGHPEPFGLKYVEIGSENYGPEYERRFVLFRDAIRKRYPEVTVISSAPIGNQVSRLGWIDSHCRAGERFFISSSDRFDHRNYPRKQPPAFIGELGMNDPSAESTLQAAVAEACFLVGAENNPDRVRRLAYAPVLGNEGFAQQRSPLIHFFRDSVRLSPSYHVWQLFANHRGDRLLKSEVETYHRSGVRAGRAGLYLFDNSFEFEDVQLNGVLVDRMEVVSGGWKLPESGCLVPEANRWNQVLLGDSESYETTYSLKVRRTKGSGNLQIRMCDKGLDGDEADFFSLVLGEGQPRFYHQSGTVRDEVNILSRSSFESHRWYEVRLTCDPEGVSCWVDGQLVASANWPTIPSLACVSTVDEEARLLIVKVVNTTLHEERTALYFDGLQIGDEGEVICLTGNPEAGRDYESAGKVRPVRQSIQFSPGMQPIYVFPPSSVTILKLPLL